MTSDVSDGRLRLDDQLCFAMYDAANAITRAYRAYLTPLELTYSQYLVLLVLWEDDRQTVSDIARRLNLGAHAVTPIVNRMAARGLVERVTRQAEDLRRVDVLLTDAGRELHDRARDIQRAVAAETGLVADDLELLRDQLRVVSARLGDADRVGPTSREAQRSG